MKQLFQKMASGAPKFTKAKPGLTPRRISQQTANLILACSLLGLIALGIANITVNSIRLARMETAKPLVVSNKDSRNISNKVGLFMTDFLSTYFKNGEDTNKSHLDTFYDPNIDVKNKDLATLESRLLSATLIEITDDLATYRVTYEVSKTDSTQTVSRVINIPYKEKDGKFYVSSLPYFTNLETYVAEGLERSSTGLKQQIGADDYEAERTYVEAFFKAYASGDVTQLAPFSKKLILVEGFQFVSLDYTYFFKDGDYLVALAQVTFEDTAGFPHQENFSLTLSKQTSGTYFVEDLKHNLIDIKEEEK